MSKLDGRKTNCITVLPFANSQKNHGSVSICNNSRDKKTLAEIAVEEQPLEEALPPEANGPAGFGFSK